MMGKADKQHPINRRLLLLLAAGLVAALLLGCYPDAGISSRADYDVVLTIYDTATDFSTVDSMQRYFLWDTVIYLDTSVDTVLPQNNVVIAQVAQNMNTYGWTRARNRGCHAAKHCQYGDHGQNFLKIHV